MRNKLLMFAGALALLAVLGNYFAKPVLAQVRAALVQSIDEPGRNPYQQTVMFNQTAGICSTFVCTVSFNPVPAGFRLVITHASATFGLAVGGSSPSVMLTTGVPNSSGFVVGLELPAPTFIGFSSYTVSSPVTYYVGPGQTPTMQLAGNQVSNGGNTRFVTIVGHLVSVP